MEQQISKYRRKIRNQRNWGIVFRVLALLLCFSVFAFATTMIAGWRDQLKVEDNFSKVIIMVMMAVLLLVATIVGYGLPKNRRRYNVALARLDLLILRLKINDDKDMSTAAINRELQLIARIMETNKDINKNSNIL